MLTLNILWWECYLHPTSRTEPRQPGTARLPGRDALRGQAVDHLEGNKVTSFGRSRQCVNLRAPTPTAGGNNSRIVSALLAHRDEASDGQPHHVGGGRTRCSVGAVRSPAPRSPTRGDPDRGSQSRGWTGALGRERGETIASTESKAVMPSISTGRGKAPHRWNIDTGASIPQLNHPSILEFGPEVRSWTLDVDEARTSEPAQVEEEE